jgi:hypothetical protein
MLATHYEVIQELKLRPIRSKYLMSICACNLGMKNFHLSVPTNLVETSWIWGGQGAFQVPHTMGF